MKKLKSSITNMVLVLTGVSVITGGILAYVNEITKEPIRLQAEKTLADGIKAVMGGADLTVAKDDTVKQDIDGKKTVFVIHSAVDKAGKPIGAAVESTTHGFGGDLKVLVGFNTEGNILGYTLLQHSETPGLGAKADKWFQKDGKGNIIGRNPGTDNMTVSKDGGKIDAITASTITSRAFLRAVCQAYNAYCGEGVDGSTSASKQEHEEEKGSTDAKTSASKQEHKTTEHKADTETSASKQEHKAESKAKKADATTSASKQEHKTKAKVKAQKSDATTSASKQEHKAQAKQKAQKADATTSASKQEHKTEEKKSDANTSASAQKE